MNCFYEKLEKCFDGKVFVLLVDGNDGNYFVAGSKNYSFDSGLE